MDTDTVQERRRFAPEKRRTHLLDCAAELVARDGMAQLSMEGIGRAAGVSKSLVYNYFDNLTQVLRELLERELCSLQRAQLHAAEGAGTFEELVRGVTHAYLAYISRRGLIVERLRSEPSVAGSHDPAEAGRDAAVEYLSKIAIGHFGFPADRAAAVTSISLGLLVAAGRYLLRYEGSRQEIEDMTVAMMIGAFVSTESDFWTHEGLIRR